MSDIRRAVPMTAPTNDMKQPRRAKRLDLPREGEAGRGRE